MKLLGIAMRNGTHFIFLFFSLSLSFVFSQAALGPIDLTKVDHDLLEDLFLKKLNTHRQELGIKPLLPDPILKLAAADQSAYLLRIKDLSHRQPTKGKETAGDRIVFYKGRSEHWGENCIYIRIKKSSKKNPSMGTVKTYQETADYLFETWKKSKGHYANMINKSFTKQGIAFSIGMEGELYGTEVFSE